MKSNLINKNYEKPFLNLKSSNFISKNCSINNLTHRINNQLNLNSFQKNEKLLSKNSYLEKFTIKKQYIESYKSKVKTVNKIRSFSVKKKNNKNNSVSLFLFNENNSYAKNMINNQIKKKEKNKIKNKKNNISLNSINNSVENSIVNDNNFSVRTPVLKNKYIDLNKDSFSLNESSSLINKKLNKNNKIRITKSILNQFINIKPKNLKKIHNDIENNNFNNYDDKNNINIENYNQLKEGLINHFSNQTIKEENSTEKLSEKNVTSPTFFNKQITFINSDINKDNNNRFNLIENNNENNINDNLFHNPIIKNKTLTSSSFEKTFSFENTDTGNHIQSLLKNKKEDKNELNEINDLSYIIRENHNKQKINRSNKYEENKENLINDIYKKSINNSEKKKNLENLTFNDIEKNIKIQIQFTEKYNIIPITVCQLLQYFNQQNYLFIKKFIEKYSNDNNDNLVLIFSLKLILKNISMTQLLVTEFIENFQIEKEESEINQKRKMLINLFSENLTLIKDFLSK